MLSHSPPKSSSPNIEIYLSSSFSDQREREREKMRIEMIDRKGTPLEREREEREIDREEREEREERERYSPPSSGLSTPASDSPSLSSLPPPIYPSSNHNKFLSNSHSLLNSQPPTLINSYSNTNTHSLINSHSFHHQNRPIVGETFTKVTIV
jgi:hypothetical protein